MEEETITITKKEYFDLRVTQEMMSRLEAGGVDGWEWYGESLHIEDSQSMDEFEDELKKELGIK